MERPRPPLTAALLNEHCLVALTTFAAALGFWTLYESWRFVPAVVIAIIAASAITVIARWYGLPTPTAALLSLVALIFVGTAVAERRVPPIGAVDFIRDAARTWRLTLDTAPPIRAAGTGLLVSFVAAWLAAGLAGELAARTRTPALPLVGPGALLATAILFGGEDRASTAWVGTTTFALGIAVVVLRGARQQPASAPARTGGAWALAGVALLASTVVAPALADQLPFADSENRYSLRDAYDQPFDPNLLPSPLAQVKEYLAANAGEVELFTLSGPPADRIRLATLSTYDGVVWGFEVDESSLLPVSTSLPRSNGETQDGEVMTYEIVLADHRGPWLPVPGSPTGIEPTGSLEQEGFLFDSDAANIFYRHGLRSGQSYRITTRGIRSYTAESPPPAAVASDTAQFAEFTSRATSIVETSEAIDTTAQLQALLDWFEARKYFDEEAKPGHHRAALTRFLTGTDGSLFGYEEQYAAALAVLARSLGIDVRVVVGYEVAHEGTTPTVVRRSNLRAWNEVRTADGWLTIDITPNEDRSQTEAAEVASQAQEAGAFPAPPPPAEEEPPPTTRPPEEEDPEEPEEQQIEEEPFELGPIHYVLIGLAALIALAGLTALLIAGAKRRRRSRRRRAAVAHARMSGAWHELVDVNVDFGYDPSPGATIQEQAVAMTSASRLEFGDLALLADGADRASFDLDEPDPVEADELWQEFDRVEALMKARHTRRARLLARVRPRSLRRRRGRQRP